MVPQAADTRRPIVATHRNIFPNRPNRDTHRRSPPSVGGPFDFSLLICIDAACIASSPRRLGAVRLIGSNRWRPARGFMTNWCLRRLRCGLGERADRGPEHNQRDADNHDDAASSDRRPRVSNRILLLQFRPTNMKSAPRYLTLIAIARLTRQSRARWFTIVRSVRAKR